MSNKSADSIYISSFLKDLNRTDRRVYVITIMLFFVQIVLTVVKIEVTPFFLFGMYSEKFVSSDTVPRLELVINGQPLSSYDVPVREQQLLVTTTENYIRMQRNKATDFVRTRIEGKLPAVVRTGFYASISDRIYNNPSDQVAFRTWLKNKCLQAAQLDTGQVTIVESTYLLNRTTQRAKSIRHEILESL